MQIRSLPFSKNLTILIILLTLSVKSHSNYTPEQKYKNYFYSALVTNLSIFPFWSSNISQLLSLNDNGCTFSKFLTFTAQYFLLTLSENHDGLNNLIHGEHESTELIQTLLSYEPAVLSAFYQYIQSNPLELSHSE